MRADQRPQLRSEPAERDVFDDSITQGFGNRNYTWDMSAELVHELAPGLSLTAGYYRNWAGNWRARDNILVGPEDFDPYCVTAPMHPQLRGGGGYEVCGSTTSSREVRAETRRWRGTPHSSSREPAG